MRILSILIIQLFLITSLFQSTGFCLALPSQLSSIRETEKTAAVHELSIQPKEQSLANVSSSIGATEPEVGKKDQKSNKNTKTSIFIAFSGLIIGASLGLILGFTVTIPIGYIVLISLVPVLLGGVIAGLYWNYSAKELDVDPDPNRGYSAGDGQKKGKDDVNKEIDVKEKYKEYSKNKLGYIKILERDGKVYHFIKHNKDGLGAFELNSKGDIVKYFSKDIDGVPLGQKVKEVNYYLVNVADCMPHVERLPYGDIERFIDAVDDNDIGGVQNFLQMGVLKDSEDFIKRLDGTDAGAVKQYLQQGILLDSANFMGETALYKACEKGYNEIVELLLKSGASVNIRYRNGAKSGAAGPSLNPYMLDIAMKNNHSIIVRKLLDAGAYIYHIDFNNDEYIGINVDIKNMVLDQKRKYKQKLKDKYGVLGDYIIYYPARRSLGAVTVDSDQRFYFKLLEKLNVRGWDHLDELEYKKRYSQNGEPLKKVKPLSVVAPGDYKRIVEFIEKEIIKGRFFVFKNGVERYGEVVELLNLILIDKAENINGMRIMKDLIKYVQLNAIKLKIKRNDQNDFTDILSADEALGIIAEGLKRIVYEKPYHIEEINTAYVRPHEKPILEEQVNSLKKEIELFFEKLKTIELKTDLDKLVINEKNFVAIRKAFDDLKSKDEVWFKDILKFSEKLNLSLFYMSISKSDFQFIEYLKEWFQEHFKKNIEFSYCTSEDSINYARVFVILKEKISFEQTKKEFKRAGIICTEKKSFSERKIKPVIDNINNLAFSKQLIRLNLQTILEKLPPIYIFTNKTYSRSIEAIIGVDIIGYEFYKVDEHKEKQIITLKNESYRYDHIVHPFSRKQLDGLSFFPKRMKLIRWEDYISDTNQKVIIEQLEDEAGKVLKGPYLIGDNLEESLVRFIHKEKGISATPIELEDQGIAVAGHDELGFITIDPSIKGKLREVLNIVELAEIEKGIDSGILDSVTRRLSEKYKKDMFVLYEKVKDLPWLDVLQDKVVDKANVEQKLEFINFLESRTRYALKKNSKSKDAMLTHLISLDMLGQFLDYDRCNINKLDKFIKKMIERMREEIEISNIVSEEDFVIVLDDGARIEMSKTQVFYLIQAINASA